MLTFFTHFFLLHIYDFFNVKITIINIKNYNLYNSYDKFLSNLAKFLNTYTSNRKALPLKQKCEALKIFFCLMRYMHYFQIKYIT